MLTALVLAVMVHAAPVQDTARGTIHGYVQSEPTGLPVAMAVVEADDGRHNVLAMTDSTGAYRLRVAAGSQILRVRHLDHAPTEMVVEVPPRGDVDLIVGLQHRPIALAPLDVRPSIDPGADSVAVSRPEYNLIIARRAAETAGLAEALNPGFSSLPGAPDGGGEALYVRGSAANLQLVLLDGAPVYAPFHMGGLIESFEPEVVGRAALYLGGAPARYDGGLSYVMDLSTRSGNGEHHTAGGTVDMVSATARVEGPLVGGARYLASGRTVHGASIAQLEREPFPYAFSDGLLRLDVPLPEGGVSLTAFVNQEGVRVDTIGGGDGVATWGNLAASLRYGGRFEGADVEVTLAAGRFDAYLPLRDAGRLFQLESRSDRVRAGVDFTRRSGPTWVRYGGSFERTWLTHDASQGTFQKLVTAEAPGTSVGGYLDAEWQPVGRFVLRGGVRADAFSVGGVAVLAPRGSATWLLSDRAALTLAGGRYHQYIRVPRSLRGRPLRNYVDSVRVATELAVGGATHLSMGLDQQISDDVRLGLEGFYKRFDGLPDPRAITSTDTSTYTAHNSGMDVWVRRTNGRVTGWLGYSLGWAWSTSTAWADTAARFTGRQTLTAGARGTVWRSTVVSARFAYGAALPSTRVATGGERALGGGSIPTLENSGSNVDLDTDAPLRRAAPFLRLDAEVSRTWSPRLAGRRTQVTPYLRVINALENRDGLFYRYLETDDDGDSTAPSAEPTDGVIGSPAIATLPLVPVLGVTWKF